MFNIEIHYCLLQCNNDTIQELLHIWILDTLSLQSRDQIKFEVYPLMKIFVHVEIVARAEAFS